MFQFLLKLLRKATCDAILGGVDDAMDQLKDGRRTALASLPDDGRWN